MSENKKPAAGEWWQHENRGRIFVAGIASDGRIVAELRNGLDSFHPDIQEEAWTHLPWCVDWDTPESVAETWPKWYVSEDQHIKTFIRQTSAKWARYVFASGVESPPFEVDDLRGWREVSKAEAKSRLNHTEEPICLKTESESAGSADVSTSSPFGDAMTVPTNRVAVRLFVPRRVMDDQNVDYPVRCCWSQSEIKDVATWVEVKHDTNGFFIERGES